MQSSDPDSHIIAIKASSAQQRRPHLTQMRKLGGFELQPSNTKVFLGKQRYKRRGTAIRLNQNTTVKRGGANRLRLTDAVTLDFIQQHTSIPVPRVHDVFFLRGETWLVMEYIDAPLLVKVWHQLNDQERLSCMYQLKGYIDQLRALEPPEPGKVQTIDGCGCIDTRMASEPYGPFDTIDRFHGFCGHDYLRENEPRYRDRIEKTSGRVYRTVFTHGDLGPHNI